MANRVGEIQALANPEQWRYVATKQNPADLNMSQLSVNKKGGGRDRRSLNKTPQSGLQYELNTREKQMLSSGSWARHKSG